MPATRVHTLSHTYALKLTVCYQDKIEFEGRARAREQGHRPATTQPQRSGCREQQLLRHARTLAVDVLLAASTTYTVSIC